MPCWLLSLSMSSFSTMQSAVPYKGDYVARGVTDTRHGQIKTVNVVHLNKCNVHATADDDDQLSLDKDLGSLSTHSRRYAFN